MEGMDVLGVEVVVLVLYRLWEFSWRTVTPRFLPVPTVGDRLVISYRARRVCRKVDPYYVISASEIGLFYIRHIPLTRS
jgi:hypothetical protein